MSEKILKKTCLHELCSYEYKIIVCQLNHEVGLFDKNPIYQNYIFVFVFISEQAGVLESFISHNHKFAARRAASLTAKVQPK